MVTCDYVDHSKDRLKKNFLDVISTTCTPYLITYSVYRIRTYLQKNWRTPEDLNKKKYDSNMNSRRVVIDYAFGTLKNI
jgi:hypothetical protein